MIIGSALQVPESRLAIMFGGKWEDKMVKDSQGRYFLDYVPSCFRKILECLVTKQLAGELQSIDLQPIGGSELTLVTTDTKA